MVQPGGVRAARRTLTVATVVPVAGDGSDLSRIHRPLTSQLRDFAARLASLSDLDVLAVPVVAHDDRQLGENQRLLPEQIAAVFLTCTDSARAHDEYGREF